MKLSASITSFNEERNIERTLKNLEGFADEIILIDGQSKDNTVKIAKKYTKKIFVVPNNLNLNVNKQKGFDKCTGDWILYIDADETLTDGLKDEIKKVINSNTKHNAFYMPRKAIVFNKWLKHGGYYPDYQLRLFRRGKGRFEMISVHEPLKVEGTKGYLKNPINHFGFYRSLSHHMYKINMYTTNDAEQMVKNGVNKSKLNLFFKPIFSFFMLYLWKRGFFNGWYGFMFAILATYYEFTLYAKYFEMKKYKNYLF